MSAPDLPAEAIAFLRDLKANNTRDWFRANKARYDRDVKDPLEGFRADLCARLSDLTGTALQAKSFRLHRDMRFSKDKTPYHAHLRMAFWARADKPIAGPACHLSIETDKVILGNGVLQFTPDTLAAWRATMGGNTAAARDLDRIVAGLTEKGWTLRDPDLKKPPRGTPPDHPHARYLQYKGFTIWQETPRPDAPAPVSPDALAATMAEAVEHLRWHFRFFPEPTETRNPT